MSNIDLFTGEATGSTMGSTGASTTSSTTGSTTTPTSETTTSTSGERTMDSRLPAIKSVGDLIARIKYYFDKYPVKAGIIAGCRGVVSIIAMMLAWDCNKVESVGLRILVSILAFLFAEVYILYYAIYHTIFGVTCYTSGYDDLGYNDSSYSSSSYSSYTY